jgi:hypothetical protein
LQSILALAFVNSFHLFVDAEVGAAGRAGDNAVLKQSWLMDEIARNREAWLGKGGLVAADGGASDGGDLLLNPVPNATRVEDLWYNFCHSSTRFVVEETFGRWKNRARFLLYQLDCSHKTATLLIYSSMVLHNLFTVLKDDAVEMATGEDEEWAKFFRTYEPMACPSCVRANKLHCPHAARYKDKQKHESHSANASAFEQRDAIKTALWAELQSDDTVFEDLRSMMEGRAVHASD